MMGIVDNHVGGIAFQTWLYTCHSGKVGRDTDYGIRVLRRTGQTSRKSRARYVLWGKWAMPEGNNEIHYRPDAFPVQHHFRTSWPKATQSHLIHHPWNDEVSTPWGIATLYFKDYYSEDQYAVSIKEDTAYPCLHSPKTTKERRSIRRIQKMSIRRIKDIVCEYSGRYQTWSLLQETPIRRIQSLGYAINTAYSLPLNTAYRSSVTESESLCMTRSLTNELFTLYKEPEREFRSSRRHFTTLSLNELRSPDFNLLSNQEYSEEEVAETMTETMELYMSKTRADYGSGVARPKIEDRDNFELKGQFLKELRTNTFSGSDHEDVNEHIEKVLEIIDLFHIPNITIDQVMLRAFPMSLTGAASRWLRNEPTGSITTWEGLKIKFLNKYCPPARTAKKMEEINNFQQEPNENLYQAWERFK
ncbi:zinc finger, CCHC-type containing protein [Tanacetum coccineum]